MLPEGTPDLAVTFNPVGDRVIVFPLPDPYKSKIGIEIPHTIRQEAPMFGTVIAFGKGGLNEYTPDPSKVLKEGDEVMFGRGYGEDVKVPTKDGKSATLKVLRLEHLLSVVTR